MGSMSQRGRGSPLYALGSVISYAFFFLLNLVFIKVMKTFLKGYCCCGKIRGEMCQEHFLHIQNFYLLSYPVFPCDPFSLLGSSFAGQFLIFFLSCTVSILLSFPGIISSPAPVYKTISTHWFRSFPSRYALRFLLPIQTFLEAPSEQATACSLRYLTPLAVPCTWEEFTLREYP